MAETIYSLCSILSLLCAVLLMRGYFRTHERLLLWSALCFGIFACNNLFLAVDMVLFPQLDLHGPFWRNVLSSIAGSALLFGLIWEVT